MHLGTDGLAFLPHARAVVKSPGVPREAAVIAAARERGVPVLGELELGWRLLPNEFVAVTGTNGKTTTVELLGHIHREAGVPVAVAGNVGTALSALAGDCSPRDDRRLRGELVSARGHARLRARGRGAAQRRGRPPRPPRHAGGLPRREAADLRAPGQRRRRGGAVRAGGRGPRRLRAARAVRPRRRARRPRRPSVVGRRAADRPRGDPPARRAQPRQRGGRGGDRARARDRSRRRARRRCARSPASSIASRRSRTVDGVLFVNDSKATNVASTLVALASFADAPVHLILGGQGKGQDFTALRGRAHARSTSSARTPSASAARRAASRCGDLATAVARARAAARPGDVVLLSPACASFDQFDGLRGARARVPRARP